MAPSPSAASSRPATASRSTTRTSTAPAGGSPPEPVPLARFAELVHEAVVPLGEPVVVRIDRPDGDELSFGTWVVPPTVDHPADPLVGLVAPKAWDALGLVVAGRDHATGEADHRRLALTVLTDRAGGWASVIERSGEDRKLLTDRPAGWVADLLDRALGRATPPPSYAPSHVLEAEWLDAVAQVVLPSPGGRHRWSRLAALHPLAPPGPPVPGSLLAAQATALDGETNWTRLRERFRSDGNPSEHRVPGGATLPLPRWFDDGSFSRWAQRRQPESGLLLQGILDAVSADVGAELVDALISVTAPPPMP